MPIGIPFVGRKRGPTQTAPSFSIPDQTAPQSTHVPDQTPEYGEPVSIHEAHDKRHTKAGVSDKRCAGCLIGLRAPQDSDSDIHLAKVWGCFADNICRISQANLFELVNRTYQKHYIDRFKEKNLPCEYPEWSARGVEEHVRYHMVHAEFEVWDDLVTLKVLRELLEEHGMVRDEESGRVKPNKDAIELLLKSIDRRQNVLQRLMKPKG